MNEGKQLKEEEINSINIMELLYKMLEKWHLFAIAIVISVIACIFIKHSVYLTIIRLFLFNKIAIYTESHFNRIMYNI